MIDHINKMSVHIAWRAFSRREASSWIPFIRSPVGVWYMCMCCVRACEHVYVFVNGTCMYYVCVCIRTRHPPESLLIRSPVCVWYMCMYYVCACKYVQSMHAYVICVCMWICICVCKWYVYVLCMCVYSYGASSSIPFIRSPVCIWYMCIHCVRAYEYVYMFVNGTCVYHVCVCIRTRHSSDFLLFTTLLVYSMCMYHMWACQCVCTFVNNMCMRIYVYVYSYVASSWFSFICSPVWW